MEGDSRGTHELILEGEDSSATGYRNPHGLPVNPAMRLSCKYC